MHKLSSSLLQSVFGVSLQENMSLAKYTSARIGGNADYLLVASTSEELENFVSLCWENDISFRIIGGGSNILISDNGVHELVILNKTKTITFHNQNNINTVWADSGVNLGNLAKKCAQKGLGGLAWAAGIPGTVGGAVFGNAGAHGSEITDKLVKAVVSTKNEKLNDWSVSDLDYSYRSSKLKKTNISNVIIGAEFNLIEEDKEIIEDRMNEFKKYRRETQPPGASMGSMFKNPENDYAGRLIEEVGLKGKSIGGAKISDFHGNFIINNENATAEDVFTLLNLAKTKVFEKFNLELQLEIELLGEWETKPSPLSKTGKQS